MDEKQTERIANSLEQISDTLQQIQAYFIAFAEHSLKAEMKPKYYPFIDKYGRAKQAVAGINITQL